MKLSLDASALCTYVSRQAANLFPDRDLVAADLSPFIDTALERMEYCFTRIFLKNFFDGKEAVFNHLNTDQYAMFLYWLSNSIHRAGGDPRLAAKMFALNKALHALDLYFEVELPDVFAFQHPVGSVIGRGHYSSHIFFYQRCTVGMNLEGVYPTLGKGVVLYGGSMVVGRSHIGNNVWVSAGTVIINQNIPSDSVVFGRSPDLVFKAAKRDVIQKMFLRKT